MKIYVMAKQWDAFSGTIFDVSRIDYVDLDGVKYYKIYTGGETPAYEFTEQEVCLFIINGAFNPNI